MIQTNTKYQVFQAAGDFRLTVISVYILLRAKWKN